MEPSRKRKAKENKPVLAICYDFDKTLSPDDMQAQAYIQSVYKEDVASFWQESNKLAEDNEMDTNLAYMFMMVREARGKNVLTKESLQKYGSEVKLFPGVDTWFKRIKDYGEKNGVIVEHYIISSGLKEMIEGTEVAKEGSFEKIYASSFMFDDRNVPIWPAQVINYTNKTQFLFRIEKGILDVNDSGVNDFFAPEDIRVPFRNIVYIGDSDTDIPCMKLVNSYGGHSIGVFNNDTFDKTKVHKMLHDKRIKYYAPADYTENSQLDHLIKAIINKTVANELLEEIHYKCKEEQNSCDNDKIDQENKRKKLDLIVSLNGSCSFSTTHTIIKELSEIKVDLWEQDEINTLLQIALENNQVRYILNDLDVKFFYKQVIKQLNKPNENSKSIKQLFESNGEQK